jgi:hypothetical protein
MAERLAFIQQVLSGAPLRADDAAQRQMLLDCLTDLKCSVPVPTPIFGRIQAVVREHMHELVQQIPSADLEHTIRTIVAARESGWRLRVIAGANTGAEASTSTTTGTRDANV